MTQLTKTEVRKFLLKHFSANLTAIDMTADELGDDVDLLDVGILDSLGVLEMISAVETHFNVTVDFELMDPEELAVFGKFIHFVANNAACKPVQP